MVIRKGACRFGYWWVHVDWSGRLIHKVQFSRRGKDSFIPIATRQFVNGKKTDIPEFNSIALSYDHPYREIYRAVCEIPYGRTQTYSDIGEKTGFHARTVGVAMKRNPTPLIVPCHRVVAKTGVGGFTPDIEIKKALIEMERKRAILLLPKKANISEGL